MNIFVLEDNADRIKEFASRYIKYSLVICNNVEKAISILTLIKFDIVFLDHDLEGKVYVPPTNPNTGTRVCEMIVKGPNSDTPTIVHTFNHVAAERMMGILRSNPHHSIIKWEEFGTKEFWEEVTKVESYCGDKLVV